MKKIKNFAIASLSMFLLTLLVVSCEKSPTLVLDTNEIESLVNLQRNIVKEFSLLDSDEQFIQSNEEDLVLFENKFSTLYQNFGEKFTTLYNEKYAEETLKDYEFKFLGKVQLRGTPCYDRYEARAESNANTNTLCTIRAFGNELALSKCAISASAAVISNAIAFEQCLEDIYE